MKIAITPRSFPEAGASVLKWLRAVKNLVNMLQVKNIHK